ncbi:MAG: hypothetical protein Q9163_001756 [Psora crenata]
MVRICDGDTVEFVMVEALYFGPNEGLIDGWLNGSPLLEGRFAAPIEVTISLPVPVPECGMSVLDPLAGAFAETDSDAEGLVLLLKPTDSELNKELALGVFTLGVTEPEPYGKGLFNGGLMLPDETPGLGLGPKLELIALSVGFEGPEEGDKALPDDGLMLPVEAAGLETNPEPELPAVPVGLDGPGERIKVLFKEGFMLPVGATGLELKPEPELPAVPVGLDGPVGRIRLDPEPELPAVPVGFTEPVGQFCREVVVVVPVSVV